MSEELKVCPFCGSPARIAKSSPWSVQVECTGENCKVFPGWYDCARLAAEAWNRRAPDPAVKALVEAAERICGRCSESNGGAGWIQDVANLRSALAALKEGK